MSTASGLRQACQSSDLELVAAIMKERDTRRGMDEEDWQDALNDCLFDAIASSNRSLVGTLLTNRAQLTNSSFSILMNRQQIEILEELVSHGFDVNTLQFMGQPPLRLAVKNPALVQWLLSHGAQPDLANDRGTTPLGTCAILELSPEIEQTIDLLLSAGANLSKEKGILHAALRPTALGGTSMLKHLVSRGADPSYEDPDTGTPLHYAAALGLTEEVKVLAQTPGVDLNAVLDGFTAADVARSQEYEEVAELLESFGKKQTNEDK